MSSTTLLLIAIIVLFIWSRNFRVMCKYGFKIAKFVTLAVLSRLYHTLVGY